MKVKHTKDRERHYRMGGVEFPAGTRVLEGLDEETALQAAEHADIELVEEPEDSDDSEEEED